MDKALDLILELLKLFGPAVGVYIVAHYRTNAVEAKNKVTIAELKTKLLQNGIDVEKENVELSASAVIDKYAGLKPKPK